MDLQARRVFYKIAIAFRDGVFDIKTVSQIVENVRHMQRYLTDMEAKELLEIPFNVLKNDVHLKNDTTWVKDNSSYFSDNICVKEKEFEELWRRKFKVGDFNLPDITKLCEFIKNDFNKYGRNDYLLRNMEVTLRNGVEINESSDFNQSGEVFWQHMKTILNNYECIKNS